MIKKIRIGEDPDLIGREAVETHSSSYDTLQFDFIGVKLFV